MYEHKKGIGKFQPGDKTRVKDRPDWPGGYSIGRLEGTIVEVKADPRGYVVIMMDRTGYHMAFPVWELDKI